MFGGWADSVPDAADLTLRRGARARRSTAMRFEIGAIREEERGSRPRLGEPLTASTFRPGSRRRRLCILFSTGPGQRRHLRLVLLRVLIMCARDNLITPRDSSLG